MAMTHYTGFEWLLIDVANQYGKDKLLFEDRIQWTRDNLEQLESLADEAETKPLYHKAVMAIRKAQKGIPTGHMVGVDATCSGIQMMSVLTGCIAGATATGLVNPNKRADAYSECTDLMGQLLGNSLNVSRADAKQALMTSYYGSKLVPLKLFGEDTPEISAFYKAATSIAPGPWELLQDLLGAWQPYALEHAWKLPDGFDVRIKVMAKVEARIEVDELDHTSFTYEFKENKGSKRGVSLVANVTHSVDGYVLRSMHRRCNYNRELAQDVAQAIEVELIERSLGLSKQSYDYMPANVSYYLQQYKRSTVADIVIMPFLDEATVKHLDIVHLQKLSKILNDMLMYTPFELVTVHDEFKAHPNHINQVRFHYKEIMAELAESHLIDDILSSIHGVPGKFSKLSDNLGELIRESAYALC